MKIHKTLGGQPWPSGTTSGVTSARGLPPELAMAAVQSLGSLALTVSFVMVAVGLLDVLYRRAMVVGAAPTRWDLIALSVVLSLILYFACRRSQVEPARLLDLGAVYQVLVGLLSALHFLHPAPGQRVAGRGAPGRPHPP